MPYSPLGQRKTNPRFTEGNFEQNLRIVDEVRAVASELDATPAQVALAWLLAQGDDIAPIPGTKRISRVEENPAADAIELSADQLARLDDLQPPRANATTKRTWRRRPLTDPPVGTRRRVAAGLIPVDVHSTV